MGSPDAVAAEPPPKGACNTILRQATAVDPWRGLNPNLNVVWFHVLVLDLYFYFVLLNAGLYH